MERVTYCYKELKAGLRDKVASDLTRSRLDFVQNIFYKVQQTLLFKTLTQKTLQRK